MEISLDLGSLRFTVSMGIATLDKGDVDFTGLMKRADQALYDAKAAGRNCTMAFGEADMPAPAIGFGDDDLTDSPHDARLPRSRHV